MLTNGANGANELYDFITFENTNIRQINIDDKNCIKIFNNHVSYLKKHMYK
jgi:hypothetical protein